MALDLSRARFLVMRLEGRAGAFSLDTVTFSRKDPPAPAPASRSAWAWDSRIAAENPRLLLDRLVRHGIGRIYLQVVDDLEPIAPFMAQAARQGITVWGLDGSPESVNDFAPLLRRMDMVASFNLRHPDTPFAGFQLDVEPYLLKDFGLRRSHYAAAYLQLLDQAAARCHASGILLSVALPFWFHQIPINGRDLGWEALKRADEAVVMAYRTDYAELLEIGRPLLSAGEKLGKPVLIGVELTRIADEVHLVLRPCAPGLPRAVTLGGRSWEIQRSYVVAGDRLSFARLRPALAGLLAKSPPYDSFRGWVLHSVEALETLP